MTTTTTEARPPVNNAARVASERTAWAYVTAMHAAAVGGARAPIRGIVEDVEDMRVQLTRERDVARARVAALERQIEGRKPLSDDDREFIAEHIGEGLVFSKYGFAHKARVQFETVLERFPDNLEALHGLLDLYRPEADRAVEAREQRTRAELQRIKEGAAPTRAKTLADPAKTRITLPELLMNEGLITLEQCLEAMKHQKQNGGRFSTAFVKLGFLTEKQVIAVLARVYGIPSIDLEHVQANPALTHQVLPSLASFTLGVVGARLMYQQDLAGPPGRRIIVDAQLGKGGFANYLIGFFKHRRDCDGGAGGREHGLTVGPDVIDIILA